MGNNSKGASDEWYTPKYIFDSLGEVFDMDVASPLNREYTCVPAIEFISENSLAVPWKGFIWMNPPYGTNSQKILWLTKFLEHGNGIALLPDRTSAPWWQFIAPQCDAFLFVYDKIKFIDKNGRQGGSPGNGTTLFAVGDRAVKALLFAEENFLGRVYRTF